MATKKELATQKTEDAALAIPDFINATDELGSTHIKQEDMLVPRLRIAQGLSPQLQDGDANYIEDLKLGDAFNDVTGEIYGKEPLDIIVVRADAPRWVEFAPRDQGGGVIDGDVPADDPRTQFTVNEKGERVKPVATKFYDFVALVGEKREPLAVSFKSSALKSAMRLNRLICMPHPPDGRRLPIYACRYTLTPIQQKNDVGVWYIFSVQPNGFVKTQEEYDFAKKAFEVMKEHVVKYDTTPDDTAAPDPDDEDAEKEPM